MSNGLRQEDRLRRLLEQDAVITTINRLFRSTDELDWPQAETCFAPRVLLDMTSVTGEELETTTPAAIVETWRESLGHLQAIHHQTGNLDVDVNGNEADASCYGIAYHFLPHDTGRSTRTFVGTYDIHLRKHRGSWRIDKFRYNLKFRDGNLDLEE